MTSVHPYDSSVIKVERTRLTAGEEHPQHVVIDPVDLGLVEPTEHRGREMIRGDGVRLHGANAYESYIDESYTG